MDPLYNMKREMLRRGLSRKTIQTYMFYAEKFLLFCRRKELKNLSKKDVREYLYNLQKRNLSGSSMNVAHNAVRFLMINILHRGFYLKIKFCKTPKRIPEYLTKEEVKRILSYINNEKHNLIISLMYGAGLRVSEVISLKPEHLDLKTMTGWVRYGKGNKDRPFIIPASIKDELERNMGGTWIFPGRKGHITARSIQQIVKEAGKEAGIKKHIHSHIFRHSFATHLIESGHGISDVQSLLGHSNPETTLIYTHSKNAKMIKIKSPMDDIK